MFDSLKKLFKEQTSTPLEPNFDALTLAGKEHVRGGNWIEAARSFRKALELRTDNVDSLVSLGFALLQQGELKEADTVLRRVVTLADHNADAHFMLGTIASRLKDSDMAISHLARAVALEPGLSDGYRDLSIAYFNTGQIDAAKEAITRAIAIDPASAEFRMILGNLLDNAKDHLGALAAYQSGLSLQPSSPELHNNMGNALRAMGRLAAATTSYRAALSFKPDFADAYINLGNAMRDEGRLPEALVQFKEALAIAPDALQARVGAAGILTTVDRPEEAVALLDAALPQQSEDPALLFAKASALSKLRRFDEAIAINRHLIRVHPELVSAHVELGNALVHKGERAEAVNAYRRAVDLDPDNPVAHLVSALSGGNTERAPDEYVARLFDGYADKFDSHLVKTLQYNMPDQIAEKLRSVNHPSRGAWRVLDLGCGTGLAGVAIGDDAKYLVGVDLSEKMLDKARALNRYARLVRADLDAMMQLEETASYDVVVAADVFVYIGKLDELVAQASRLLRSGGLFAFSVEALVADRGAAVDAEPLADYRLNATGRYAHMREYVHRLASASGFDVLGISDAHGRVNEGKPVPGYIGLFRR